ncbi:MAG: NAD-dependent deacylase [Deltaproteobacteria bacterium]|nr:NAD-dependent deacylase [Deltaproteobacteria bacterium]
MIAEALGGSGRLAVLTGAGISAESGLKTFRDPGGLWQQYRLEELATPEAFRAHPERVLEFYNMRRAKLSEVHPNAGHVALAALERRLEERFTLITQNVDDLHERAGSRRLLHMHGELKNVRCVRCAAVVPWTAALRLGDRCAACQGQLRPHIVWFGEVPFFLDDAIPAALAGATFLSIGTSGTVYPAAGFVAAVKAQGGLTAEVNLEPSANAELFDLQVLGKAGEVLPTVLEAIGGAQAPA